MTAETLISEALEAVRKEGVMMAPLGEIEARLMTLLHRARNERKADSMLPLLGAEIAAERIGCCPRTVYNLAERARKKKMQGIATACG